jgi:glycosyltransferase involved in cell wall biosynthesis
MRILFLTHSAQPAGAELSLLRLVTSMPNDENLVVFTEHGPLVDRFRTHGVRVEVVEGSTPVAINRQSVSPIAVARAMWVWACTGRQVGKLAREFHADVIVARSNRALLMGAVARQVAGAPLVWSVHDQITSEYLGPVRASAMRFIGARAASAFIANSHSTLWTVRTKGKPAHVAPPGLHLGEFDRRPRKAGKQLTIAMVGRLAPWKGQEVFLRALALSGIEQFKALVVGGAVFGESEYEARLHGLVNQLGLGKQVEFTGHLDDVGPVLSETDILVHASVLPEPFGAVVIEGMAAGCCVIASKGGGTSEIISHEMNGLLVNRNDPLALAQNLRRVICDLELRNQMQECGRKDARRFDVNGIAADLHEWLGKTFPL